MLPLLPYTILQWFILLDDERDALKIIERPFSIHRISIIFVNFSIELLPKTVFSGGKYVNKTCFTQSTYCMAFKFNEKKKPK